MAPVIIFFIRLGNNTVKFMKDIEVCASTTYEKQHKKPRNWEKYEYEKCKINYKTYNNPYAIHFMLKWHEIRFLCKGFFFVVVKGRLEENCIHSLKKYILQCTTSVRHKTHYILFMKVYLLFCVSWRVSKLKALLFLLLSYFLLGCYNVEDFHRKKNFVCDFTYNIVNVLYASIFLQVIVRSDTIMKWE